MKSSFQLSSKKISQLESELINELQKQKQQKQQQISLVRPPPVIKMSTVVQLINELLRKSPKTLKKIFNCPSKSMLGLKIYSSLLTQYYFNDRQLFLMSIELAKKNLFQILASPTMITSSTLTDIRTCIMILRLCTGYNPKNPQQIYICSICGYTYLNYWCKRCEQVNRVFIYPYECIINLDEQWRECKQGIDYFIDFQLGKVYKDIQEQLRYIFQLYCQVIS